MLISKLNRNHFFLFSILIIFIIWVKSVAFYEPILHPEFVQSAGFMTMKTESGKADLYKIFDSSETELGYYRPRVISFLLQYIDSHFFYL